MNAVSPAAELQSEFFALLEVAVRAHANQFDIRIQGDVAQVVASLNGEQALVAEWPASKCEAFLPAVFSLCDGADDYVYGSSRSVRMTGEKVALPASVSMVLVQFFAPRDGARCLVARITREGDTCCGTCGG